MRNHGWAIVANDEIDMRTVGPTPRSAKVNWLFLRGCLILNSASDMEIEGLWQAYRGLGDHIAECARVEVYTHNAAMDREYHYTLDPGGD